MGSASQPVPILPSTLFDRYFQNGYGKRANFTAMMKTIKAHQSIRDQMVMMTIIMTLGLAQVVSASKEEVAAAICLAAGKSCKFKDAKLSGVCKWQTYPKKQPNQCTKKACMFCSRKENENSKWCKKGWAIKNLCPLFLSIYPSQSPSPTPSVSSTPSVTPTTSPSASPSSKSSCDQVLQLMSAQSAEQSPVDLALPCTWVEHNGKVVISLAMVAPFSHWSRNKNALTWRFGNKATRTDRGGSGKMCFHVVFMSTGTFHVTARTASPHWSDHNDMWIQFDGGLDLFQAGTNIKSDKHNPLGYIKAYQNGGQYRVMDIISSVDHNPHIFVTQPLKRYHRYKICISGRSSMFTVFDLVFIKCTGGHCMRNSKHIRTEMKTLMTSLCL